MSMRLLLMEIMQKLINLNLQDLAKQLLKSLFQRILITLKTT